MREHPGWSRRYRLRNQPGCRRRRKRKPETREWSRRLRALPSKEAGNAIPAFGPDHFLSALRIARGRIAGEFLERKAVDELLHFRPVQNFALEQRQGNANQRIGAVVDHFARAIVAVAHELLNLLVDADRGRFTEIAVLRDLAAKENLLFLLAERERPKLAHAPLANHLAREV